MADNLKQVLQECNQTCQDLSNILATENQYLESRNIKAVEGSIKTKKQLTIKLEKFVNVIKNNIQIIQQQADALRELQVFKVLIGAYQKLLAKNTMLLKAAQTATKMILEGIQKQTKRITVQTYNAYGNVQQNVEQGQSIINYSV